VLNKEERGKMNGWEGMEILPQKATLGGGGICGSIFENISSCATFCKEGWNFRRLKCLEKVAESRLVSKIEATLKCIEFRESIWRESNRR
jgi:predicted transcriptional regulator